MGAAAEGGGLLWQQQGTGAGAAGHWHWSNPARRQSAGAERGRLCLQLHRTQWHDVMGHYCPKYGVDRLVRPRRLPAGRAGSAAVPTSSPSRLLTC